MTDDRTPTARFSSRVADSMRYRPTYPAALFAWLREAHGADVRCGAADSRARAGDDGRIDSVDRMRACVGALH